MPPPCQNFRPRSGLCHLSIHRSHRVGADSFLAHQHIPWPTIFQFSQYGDPTRFVQGASHYGQHNFTQHQACSWMAVDLKRQLIPSYYCLRSDKHSGCHEMRHRRLEGSNDGSSWMTLRYHSDDMALAGDAFPVAHWPLPDVATAYRHFRIYQTDNNSHGKNFCAGIELYGVLLGAD